MARMEPQSILQRTFSILLRNRIRLSFVIFALFLFEDIVIEGVRPHDLDSFQDPWGFAGLLLVLGGVGLRSWAAGIIRKGKSLATTGPYSLTRHPLYVGSLLMGLGFCAIIGDEENIWLVLGIALMVYYPKIRHEELSLAKKFGEEWNKYAHRTSLLFPKRIPPNIRLNWSLAQWLRNREYRAFATSLVALVVLELMHEFPISELLVATRYQ